MSKNDDHEEPVEVVLAKLGLDEAAIQRIITLARAVPHLTPTDDPEITNEMVSAFATATGVTVSGEGIERMKVGIRAALAARSVVGTGPDEAPKRTAAELLREAAIRDPERHNQALAAAYGAGPALSQQVPDEPQLFPLNDGGWGIRWVLPEGVVHIELDADLHATMLWERQSGPNLSASIATPPVPAGQVDGDEPLRLLDAEIARHVPDGRGSGGVPLLCATCRALSTAPDAAGWACSVRRRLVRIRALLAAAGSPVRQADPDRTRLDELQAELLEWVEGRKSTHNQFEWSNETRNQNTIARETADAARIVGLSTIIQAMLAAGAVGQDDPDITPEEVADLNRALGDEQVEHRETRRKLGEVAKRLVRVRGVMNAVVRMQDPDPDTGDRNVSYLALAEALTGDSEPDYVAGAVRRDGEPATESEREARALLGQQVEVLIERPREGKPALIIKGQLLAFDTGGEVITRDEEGFVWSCWPRLEIRAAGSVGVSAEVPLQSVDPGLGGLIDTPSSIDAETER